MSWNRTKWLLAAVMLSCLTFSFGMVIKDKSDDVVWFGKLIFNNTSNVDAVGTGQEHGFQSDQSAFSVSQLTGLRLQRLNPSVQCDRDSMSLNIQGQRVPNLMVASEMGPVPLNQMPSYCGISVKRARRGVNVVAKYDCCDVGQQGDGYVLPLVVGGAMVKMSCPASPPKPTVSCKPSAMVINFGVSTDSVKVKVSGVWQSLAQASSTCGFTLAAKSTGWQVTAPYTSKCWTIQGGQRRLSVLHINNELLLSCPVEALAATPARDMQNAGFPASPYPYGYQQPLPFGYVYPSMPLQSPSSHPSSHPSMHAKAPSSDQQVGSTLPQIPQAYSAFPYVAQGSGVQMPLLPYTNQQSPSMPLQSPSSHPSMHAKAPSSDQQVGSTLPQIPQAFSAYPYVAQGSGVQMPLVPYTNQQSPMSPRIQAYPSTTQQVVAQYSPLPVYYPMSNVNAQMQSVIPQALQHPASDQAIASGPQNVHYVQYDPLPVKGWLGK